MAYNQYARYSGNPYESESEGGGGGYGQSNPYGGAAGAGYGGSNPYGQDAYGEQVRLLFVFSLPIALSRQLTINSLMYDASTSRHKVCKLRRASSTMIPQTTLKAQTTPLQPHRERSSKATHSPRTAPSSDRPAARPQ